MEILITIGLYAVGTILFVFSLLYVQGMRVALGTVFQKPNFKRIEREDCPEYLIKFLESEEPKLLNLGFKFLYCVLSDPLVKRDTSHQYTFVYYLEGNKTYARLTASEIPDNTSPWHVGFRTEFTNGKKFMTVNGTRHMYIGSIPNTILLDARAPSLEKHLEFHLRQLAAMNEGFIKEYSEKTNPNDRLREEIHFWHHYIHKLEEEGHIFRVSEDKYKMKTRAALGLVYRMIIGVLKQIRLEQKQAGRQKSLGLEYPVELEVETYLNLKDTYRKPLKETSRNLLHLILVLILFAVPVGFILTFEIAAVLAAVVLLHELGHLAAMYWSGFKNIKLSPVPFSAASGVSEEKGIPLYKKVVAYFAGPLTGLVAVFLLVGNLKAWNFPVIPPQNSQWETASLALMLVFFVNYFNLIPISPLDGGRIFNIIFPVNSPLSKLRVIFNTIGIMGLLLTAFIFYNWELFILAMVFLYAAHISYYPKPLMNWVKNELKNNTRELVSEEEADENKKEYDWVKKIFLRLRQPPYRNYNFYKKTQLVKVVEEVIDVPRASPKLIAVTILFYLVLISVPFFYTGAYLVNYGFHPGDDGCQKVFNIPKPAELAVEKSQFVRMDRAGSPVDSLVCSRYCLSAKDNDIDINLGNFLGRLWALFGEPDRVRNGFSYTITDKENNIIIRVFMKDFTVYYYSPELKKKLMDIFRLFLELSDKTKVSEYLEVLLRYLFNSPGEYSKEEIREQVTNILEGGGDVMQTIAQQLREEGIKIGEKIGKEDNAKDTAIRMLKKGFDINTIVEITGLEPSEIKKLRD